MKIGFFGLLTIVFVTLKLIGVIDWSWVWVLAPLWGGFMLFFMMVFGLIVFEIYYLKRK
jgi:hypothetical protein